MIDIRHIVVVGVRLSMIDVHVSGRPIREAVRRGITAGKRESNRRRYRARKEQDR